VARTLTTRALLVIDLLATLLFAVEGANEAATAHLDLLGVMIVAFATALGGGVVRDLLIAATPPGAIKDWRYPATAFVGGMLVIAFLPLVQRLPAPLLTAVDAAALSLFAVTGVRKALQHGISPFMAVLMGAITGSGGGVVRDLLLVRLPAVLHTDVYAVAALFGGVVLVAAQRLGAGAGTAAIAGGCACFVLRLVAVWQHWNLPRAG
jgi:uncharacterized membrane protein YeiH